jgi:hypothetical protein
MFQLLIVFPNNRAEQERYYITNVLKKPQCMSICQFVQHVEQLNSYISHLPCWCYSPSTKAGMIPMNVALTKANLVSHILRMCPHTWQGQFNLQEKGLNPMDIHSLLQCLKAIECICTQERSNAQSTKKTSMKNKKGNQRPGTESKFPRKLVPRSIATCARNMGAHIPHTTHKIVLGTRRTEMRNPTSKQPRKVQENPI